MRALLEFTCRAFPRDYRARRSGELVDTALLAANGSPWRTAREALSLVGAGLRQRLHATEADPSVQDGVAVLAGVFAVANLAIALFGISLAVEPELWDHSYPCCGFVLPNPNAVDWWWIAFAVAAVGIVLGLALARRRLTVGAALVNLGIVGYDALVLTPHGTGHMNAISPWGWPDAYPLHQDWLAPAIVLALVTAAAPSRRRSVFHVPLALVAAALLVVIARENWGHGFIFLLWPAGLVLVLGVTLGWLAPRLAVVALGVSVALVPPVVGYVTGSPWGYHSPVVTLVAAPGLAFGIVLPLAYLARRRLT